MKALLRYPGGKMRAVGQILPHVPRHFAEYREPFAGGAALFWALKQEELTCMRSGWHRSWLSDAHWGLMLFYAVLRDYPSEFINLCMDQGKRASRKRFNYWAGRRDLMRGDSDGSPIERAVQYYYLNRTVWGGRVIYDPSRKSRLYYSNPKGWRMDTGTRDSLWWYSDRLQGVHLTGEPFSSASMQRALTTPRTFIYCDPPYMLDANISPSNWLYDDILHGYEHTWLRDWARESPAKIMLSYPDCRKIRKWYHGWRIVRVSWPYCGRYARTAAQKARGEKEKKSVGKELLIMNYPKEAVTE